MAYASDSTRTSSPHGPVTVAIQATEREHDPNRRRLLCTAVTLACISFPAAAGSVSPDADLLRLDAELEEAWAEEVRLTGEMGALQTPEADAAWQMALNRACAIADQISQVSATTLEGLKVKARACSYCVSGEPFTDTTFSEQGTTDVRLAAGVLRDLLAMRATA